MLFPTRSYLITHAHPHNTPLAMCAKIILTTVVWTHSFFLGLYIYTVTFRKRCQNLEYVILRDSMCAVLFGSIESATIFSRPPSPVRVLEGQPLKLEWTFSAQGTFRRVQLGFSGSAVGFLEMSLSSSFIEPAFSDRLTASTTERNSTITFSSVNRNDSANYVFGVSDSSGITEAPLEITVECKYKPHLRFRAILKNRYYSLYASGNIYLLFTYTPI